MTLFAAKRLGKRNGIVKYRGTNLLAALPSMCRSLCYHPTARWPADGRREALRREGAAVDSRRKASGCDFAASSILVRAKTS